MLVSLLKRAVGLGLGLLFKSTAAVILSGVNIWLLVDLERGLTTRAPLHRELFSLNDWVLCRLEPEVRLFHRESVVWLLFWA
jgi:hypothetical protein